MRKVGFVFSTRAMMKAIVVVAFLLGFPRAYQSLRPHPNLFGMGEDRYWSDIAPYVESVVIPGHLLFLATRKPPALIVKLMLAIDYCLYVAYASRRSLPTLLADHLSSAPVVSLSFPTTFSPS